MKDLIEVLQDEKEALIIWLTSSELPEDIRQGMEISLDKIETVLRSHK